MIAVGVLLIISPLALISFLLSLVLFVVVASIMGESFLEDPTTGEPTVAGMITFSPLYMLPLLLILGGIYSLIAEKISKGSKTPAVTMHHWITAHQFFTLRNLFVMAIIIVTVSIIGMFPKVAEKSGPNIGSAILLMTGVILLLITSTIFLINRHRKTPLQLQRKAK